jgi:hypothetical protein
MTSLFPHMRRLSLSLLWLAVALLCLVLPAYVPPQLVQPDLKSFIPLLLLGLSVCLSRGGSERKGVMWLLALLTMPANVLYLDCIFVNAILPWNALGPLTKYITFIQFSFSLTGVVVLSGRRLRNHRSVTASLGCERTTPGSESCLRK